MKPTMAPAGILALFICCACHLRADEVKVGVMAPLSGVRADCGAYVKNGLELALEDLQARTDRKYHISTLIEDSRYEAKTAVSAYLKLSRVDGVRFFIGPASSTEVLSVAPLSERDRAILMLYGSQSDEVSSAGKLIFRLIHNAAQDAPFFAPVVAQHMRGDTLHFLTAVMAFTEPYLKLFKQEIIRCGKRQGLTEEYQYGSGDYRVQLMRLKDAGATDIMILALPADAGRILKQARELGLKAQWYNIGVESPELIQAAGGAAEGLLYPYSYDADGDSPAVRSFSSRYLARFGALPDTQAANAYDALMLLNSCFEKAGLEVAAVSACLYSIRGYQGVGGTFSINSDGDAVKQMMVKTVHQGRFVRYPLN